jgi:uncharacterized protein (UPF0335 family)
MENRIDRLQKLAQLAKSALLHDREQIEWIIRLAEETDDIARQTADIMKRIMSRPG